MSDKDKKVDQDPNAGGDNTPENEVEPTEEEIAALPESEQKVVKSVLAQKAHWRKKAKDAEDALAKKGTEEKPKPSEPAKTASDEEWKARMEFVVTHKDLSQEEIDHAFALAKGFGKTPQEVLDTETFKDWKLGRERRASEAGATPKPGPGGAPGSEKIDFANLKEGDVVNMDDATFAKYKVWLKSQK